MNAEKRDKLQVLYTSWAIVNIIGSYLYYLGRTVSGIYLAN